MSKLYHLFTFFFISTVMSAQISTNCGVDYDTAEELLEVMTGSGILYSNATLTTANCPGGYFDGSSNIGFNSGILLATGGIESATPGNSSMVLNNWLSDIDIDLLLDEMNTNTNFLSNIIVLEFDFETASNEFSLDYVFASNEYLANTCGDNVDVFGILLSGPGIAGPYSLGAENIALVPNVADPTTYSNTSVGVNSINSGTSASGATTYCDNLMLNWGNNSDFFIDNTEMQTVNYPGFTIPLTAYKQVTPCLTYHMKIVIADVGSSVSSSALFFEESSFNSLVETEYTIQTSTDPLLEDHIYEGCSGAYLKIIRPNNNFGDVNILYHLYGTADYLTDYTLVNGSLYSTQIDSGEASVTIFIEPIDDFISEDIETIVFELASIGSGCTQTAPILFELTLSDQPLLDISLTEDFTNYCPGDDAVLEVEISGGVGSLLQQPTDVMPYKIEWSQIGTALEQLENPLDTTEYCVQVTDYCGSQILVECVTVNVNQYPDIEIDTDIVYICSDIEAELCVLVEGGEGNYDFNWSNGSNDSCIYDFNNEYTVIISDDCDQEVTVNTEIYLDEAPDPFFEYLNIQNVNLGIEFNNYTPEMDGLSYFWNFGDGFYSTQEQPSHTYPTAQNYEVSLGVTTAIAGCYKEYQNYVPVVPLFYFYAPNAFSPNNDDTNDTYKTSVIGVESFELYIFDKYGKQVFHTLDPEATWDGTYESSSYAAEGIYTFKARMKKFNTIGYYQEIGSINLIR